MDVFSNSSIPDGKWSQKPTDAFKKLFLYCNSVAPHLIWFVTQNYCLSHFFEEGQGMIFPPAADVLSLWSAL